MSDFLNALGEAADELLRRMLNSLNWRMVRALGELQILTRASFALLVIVPVLAGTWPAVRLVVNHHNRAVRDATTLLERSETEFIETLDRMKAEIPENDPSADPADSKRKKLIESLESSSATFFAHVNSYVADYSERTLKTPLLPWTLASAFFAALFVVMGHMLYQLAAPEQLRKLTWDEYVLSKKEDYAKHPSSDTLTTARTVLRSRLGRRVEESDRYENYRLLRQFSDMPEDILQRELEELGTDRLRSLQAWLRSAEAGAGKPHVEELTRQIRTMIGDAPSESSHEEMSVVERAARTEYLQYADQRRFFTLVTTLLYVCGIVILLSIVRVQTTAVANAAGWTSVFEVFSP
ncbi:hypothetical protein Poly24_17210 [Rosistilla carotiformis]|uniref:Uncharacterized protein n=1 Tax=Rosistilla carotiformis TaxID=2528017 RepID=A0A518JR52_9BACT|nr:hypothetical protein [Rosistilla carotiformis]QDV68015.1 hypothetical protein Poly24_17210 [Rosistilla carotiformis]